MFSESAIDVSGLVNARASLPGGSAFALEDEICGLQRDSGPCSDQLTQWFYDTSAAECRPFTYGGCRGNANRFNSKALCRSRCGNKNNSRGGVSESTPETSTESSDHVQNGIIIFCTRKTLG